MAWSFVLNVALLNTFKRDENYILHVKNMKKNAFMQRYFTIKRSLSACASKRSTGVCVRMVLQIKASFCVSNVAALLASQAGHNFLFS
jgi:hypothetical protein